MGPATSPRHRADTARSVAWADLRRGVAHLLAGRDLYADDAQLRSDAASAGTDGDERWEALIPATAPARGTAPA